MPQHKKGMQGDEEWNWEQGDSEGYDEEEEAQGVEDEDSDQEETRALEGSVMQVEILPMDDDGR
eukprot:381245-Prorocentrum_lima.AAC.1